MDLGMSARPWLVCPHRGTRVGCSVFNAPKRLGTTLYGKLSRRFYTGADWSVEFFKWVIGHVWLNRTFAALVSWRVAVLLGIAGDTLLALPQHRAQVLA